MCWKEHECAKQKMATTCEILFLITKLIIFPIYILYYKTKKIIIVLNKKL